MVEVARGKRNKTHLEGCTGSVFRDVPDFQSKNLKGIFREVENGNLSSNGLRGFAEPETGGRMGKHRLHMGNYRAQVCGVGVVGMWDLCWMKQSSVKDIMKRILLGYPRCCASGGTGQVWGCPPTMR